MLRPITACVRIRAASDEQRIDRPETRMDRLETKMDDGFAGILLQHQAIARHGLLEIFELHLVDLFPQTFHLETVVVLRRSS